jgi:hypothetical protein
VGARTIHHVRISGDPPKIDEFLGELQRGDYGAQVIQRQRYSDSLVAANVASDRSGRELNTEQLFARAAELGLVVKVDVVSS